MCEKFENNETFKIWEYFIPAESLSPPFWTNLSTASLYSIQCPIFLRFYTFSINIPSDFLFLLRANNYQICFSKPNYSSDLETHLYLLLLINTHLGCISSSNQPVHNGSFYSPSVFYILYMSGSILIFIPFSFSPFHLPFYASNTLYQLYRSYIILKSVLSFLSQESLL